jgi:glycosyltransferase involved in cell wall biosynthesis
MTVARLAMVTSGLGRGGSESQFVQLAAGLKERGWEVAAVTMQDGPYREVLETKKIRVQVIECGVWPTPNALWTLARALHNIRPALVHTQAFRANLWARSLAASLRLPVVASVRATYTYLPRAYFPFERVLAYAGRVVTPAAATARHLIAAVGVPANRIVVIPNSVALPATYREPTAAAGGTLRVLMPGRLVAQKDHRTLIEAVALARGRGLTVSLVIAGKGPLEGELRRLSIARGDVAVFKGELDTAELRREYAEADVVCLASHFEGMPNVVLEAMAEARPVIATDVDGAPEVVEDGVTGLVVRPGAVGDWVTALEHLGNSPALRRKLGLAGRRRAERMYTTAAMVSRHETVYRALVLNPKQATE